MTGRIVTAVTTDRTPNWEKWRLIPNCELWECVALSLNIDPDKVYKEWLEITLVIKESRKFNDRLAVALANAGDTAALRPTRYTMDSKCWAVSLREFAAWAHRIRWEAPLELLAMADEHDPGKQKASTPAAGRAHNKRDTEGRNRALRERIKELRAENPTTSHVELCRMLKQEVGGDLDVQTLRRITGDRSES